MRNPALRASHPSQTAGKAFSVLLHRTSPHHLLRDHFRDFHPALRTLISCSSLGYWKDLGKSSGDYLMFEQLDPYPTVRFLFSLHLVRIETEQERPYPATIRLFLFDWQVGAAIGNHCHFAV